MSLEIGRQIKKEFPLCRSIKGITLVYMRECVEAKCMSCNITSPQPLHREELQPQTNNMTFLAYSEMGPFSLMCPAEIA